MCKPHLPKIGAGLNNLANQFIVLEGRFVSCPKMMITGEGGGGIFGGENFGGENCATLAASRTHCTANAPRFRQGKITSQRLLDQSQAGVYMGKTPHTPPFGPIRVPYPKGLNC